MDEPAHPSLDKTGWYTAPSQWVGVANEDLSRLLGYLLLTGRARAYARKVAVSHSFPHPTPDFVADVCVGAATNARNKYRAAAGTNEKLFKDDTDVVRKGNGFLRFAFLQARHRESDPVMETVERDVLERAGEESRLGAAGVGFDGEGGGSFTGAVAEAATQLRSAMTRLVGSGMLTCVHDTGDSCYHRRGPCPSMPVVLSVALQIVASWERAWPPVEGLSVMQPAWEPPKRAKYAMLALADPDNVSARPDNVPDGQRKIVQRRWHCALQLVTTAGRVVA